MAKAVVTTIFWMIATTARLTSLLISTKSKSSLAMTTMSTFFTGGHSYQPPSALKGLFVGSGSDGMNEEVICDKVLEMIGNDPQRKSASARPVVIAYIGTATYDWEGPRERQTAQFISKGCTVKSLDVSDTDHLDSEQIKLLETADAIIVSGGNTLYALDRWKILGIDRLLREAMERGAVLTGGSAGAICWFDGGHSDSADPDTWKQAMVAKTKTTKVNKKEGDESSDAPTSTEDAKDWEYIRVPGLGFLPGLVCPHHDKTQSNGVLRANDFDNMLKRHPTEVGIGIDHWAALQVQGDSYQVVALPDKEGSVLLPSGDFSPTRQGKPGIWIKEVNKQGDVLSELCPSQGKLSQLLRHPSEIVQDHRVEDCRKDNPAN